jgi:hypothetical protein
MRKIEILIVGTLKNGGLRAIKDLRVIEKAFSPIANCMKFIVESDSTDSTIDVLTANRNRCANFDFKSLGTLEKRFPDRIERIRFCRNEYVSYIRENYQRNKWDLVVVADLDGMNRRLMKLSVRLAISRLSKWDAIFATQLLGHYDILALRMDGRISVDCFSAMQRELNSEERKFLPGKRCPNGLRKYLHEDSLRKKYIYSNMKRFPFRGGPWEVQSAFGGLAIYKTAIFRQFDYSSSNEVDAKECEHVSLHKKVIESGRKIAIEPLLINSVFNAYISNRLFIVRILRKIRKTGLKFLWSTA